MKKLLLGLSVAALTVGAAQANNSVLTGTSNPNDWVLQTGDYANQRFSKLNQINRDNVGDLQVAWTFSTGVLRGHEGSPLVVGDTMYVHTPFPNIVYALDLNNDGALDVISASFQGNELQLYLNNGDGTLQNRTICYTVDPRRSCTTITG